MYKEWPKFNDYIKVLLILVCICIPFFRLNVSVDLADTGYAINMGNFLRSAPESINNPMFLTACINHLFISLFGFLNIPLVLGFKFLRVILILIENFVIYKMYKKYMHLNLLLSALILSNIITTTGVGLFSYNQLSFLFATFLMYFLVDGYSNEKPISFLIAGIFYALNIFVRFPNIVQGVIILGLIYVGILFGDFSKRFKSIGYFIIGTLAANLIMLLLIHYVTGVGNYINSIWGLFKYAESEDTIYNFSDMLLGLYADAKHGFMCLLLLIIPTIISCFIAWFLDKIHFLNERKLKKICIILLSFLISLVLMFSINGKDSILLYLDHMNWIRMLVVLTLGIVIGICFNKNICKEMKFIAACTGLLLLSMPLGTSTRFHFYLNGFQLFMPLIFYLFFQHRKNNVTTTKIFISIISGGLFLLMSFVFLRYAATYNYGDTEDNKIIVTNDPSNVLNGIKTGKNRYQNISDLESFVSDYKGDRDHMIILGDAPLLHTILDIPPFFPEVNGWTDLSQLSLSKIEEGVSLDDSPLILVYRPGFSGETYRMSPKRHLFFENLMKSKYNIIYHNADFELYEYEGVKK